MNLDDQFLKDTNPDLFEQVSEEQKQKEEENPSLTNDEFIKSLPDWDLPPLYEKVRRVMRQ